MPRRSIILQELEENDKKLSAYAGVVDQYNANAEKTNANYQAAVNTYNTATKDPSSIGVSRESGGFGWNLTGYGTPALLQDGKYYFEATDNNEYNSGVYATGGTRLTWDQVVAQKDATYNSAAGDPLQTMMSPGTRPDETRVYTGYSSDQAGSEYQITKGHPEFDAMLAADQKAWDQEKYDVESGAIQYYSGGVVTRTDPRTGKQSFYDSGGQGVWKTYAPPVAPTAAPEPPEPDLYTLSRREEEELRNPTQDAAGVQLAATYGLPAKTELANQASTGASIYAGRDREETIEQSGILARVMAGQL